MNAMKHLLLCCVTLLTAPWAASAQVTAKASFDYPPLKEAQNFVGPVARAKLPEGWPAEDHHIRISEVKFGRGAMTRWHRHGGSQYLFATGGQGRLEYFNAEGKVVGVPITGQTKVHTPGGTCHRHGSDGTTEVFSHVYVTLGDTYWDDCEREFSQGAPAKKAPDDTVLLTIFLRHDQTKNLEQIQAIQKKQGFFQQFPPTGVEIVSWHVVMGIGQVVTLKVPAAKLRDVNVALEKSAWGAFRTEFYPTYDLYPVIHTQLANPKRSGP
ncbi:hypothetical protein ACLEPN_15255 [Myxococcus sp. 1LA]